MIDSVHYRSFVRTLFGAPKRMNHGMPGALALEGAGDRQACKRKITEEYYEHKVAGV